MSLAQAGHASARSSFGLHTEGTYILVKGASEHELLQLEHALAASPFKFVSIREPDAPWNGQLLAIGIQPAPRKALDKLLRQYPLLKEKP